MLRAMHSGTRVRPADIQGRSRECYQLAEQWDQLTIVDGILHRRHDANGRSHLQVVAPKVSHSDIMHHCMMELLEAIWVKLNVEPIAGTVLLAGAR